MADMELANRTDTPSNTSEWLEALISNHGRRAKINWDARDDEYWYTPSGGWEPVPVLVQDQQPVIEGMIAGYRHKLRLLPDTGAEGSKSLLEGLRMLDLIKSYSKAAKMSDADVRLRFDGFRAVLNDCALGAIRQAIVDYAREESGYPDVTRIRERALALQSEWGARLKCLVSLERHAEWNGGQPRALPKPQPRQLEAPVQQHQWDALLSAAQRGFTPENEVAHVS